MTKSSRRSPSATLRAGLRLWRCKKLHLLRSGRQALYSQLASIWIQHSAVSQKFVAQVAKSNRRFFDSVWPKNGQTPLKMTVELRREIQRHHNRSWLHKWLGMSRNPSSGAEAPLFMRLFTARLKSCPFKTVFMQPVPEHCACNAGAEPVYAGFQRRMGLRAACTSSSRETRVECGAVFTSSGFSSASLAIERIAAMNR